ncbi:MAG: DUF432 domain-containing protein, partial [Tannerella sp.]|nr:DUF432 domain-containing protein [Tannerella sp.]
PPPQKKSLPARTAGREKIHHVIKENYTTVFHQNGFCLILDHRFPVEKGVFSQSKGGVKIIDLISSANLYILYFILKI